MRDFTPTPYGDKDGRWPSDADIPQGAVLQCRLKSPKVGFYYVIVAEANAIPDHRNIIGWTPIPAPVAIKQVEKVDP